MAQTLDEFVAEVSADILRFSAEYQIQHETNPEHYPLELDDDNTGLWMEFFIEHMASAEGPPQQVE